MKDCMSDNKNTEGKPQGATSKLYTKKCKLSLVKDYLRRT